ncbi:MAG: hydantoinase/oxoprolinase family protein [Acidimicrobiia bacterium]
MSRVVGVDVGGTFTDVVVLDGESMDGHKVRTTADQSDGVARALSDAGIDEDTTILHGTTAGTNALIEGRGARTALVTTPGFEDLLEIGRQARPSLYDPFVDRPDALCPRELRFGYTGDVEAIGGMVDEAGAEAVAVALIRSYIDPAEELDLADRLSGRVGAPVSVGALISPQFREYERIATTVLNAYLTPELAGYLSSLDMTVGGGRRLAMTSSGGLLPFAVASAQAGRLVLSGPAAGVVAATALGRAKGHQSIISFDMGGTSTDVCRVAGRAVQTTRHSGAGWVNRVPSLPVRTIGAGGGSLAWVDQGGALRVGPMSAGADPGPAAYGRGGDVATVTDANVVLGRIPADLRLGGSIKMEIGAAIRALAVLGADLSLEIEELAAGVIEVVDTHMERALRAVSIEEGVDPRDSVLVAFGGAGGLHATRLARRLGMSTTLIPPLSGVFSAVGLLLAEPSSDTGRTVMLEEGSDRLRTVAGQISAEANVTFTRDHGTAPTGNEAWADVRYAGQSHELAVPLAGGWVGLRQEFEDLHQARFGFIRTEEPIELVNVRAEATGPAPMTWDEIPPMSAGKGGSGPRRPGDIPVWSREGLQPGQEIEGAAIIVERDSAVWLERGDSLSVHEDGTLEIHS